MIDHVSVQVSDLARATRFYEAVLGVLDYRVLASRPSTVAFGKRHPEFWLNLRADAPPQPEDTGFHVCLRARTTDLVEQFHATALAQGGRDDGAPGPRKAELGPYYGAFIRDPDGNRVEVASFPPAETD